MANDSFMIFTGTANTRLAVDVVNHLDMSLGKMTVGRFSDGEVMVEINENVRGKDVFVLQPTCAPTNDNLMEIMVMVDALRRASAGRITAAIPYFGYARQDRRPRSARGRRLSMMARSASSCLASARARTTPPMSGDTTTRFEKLRRQMSPSRIGPA